jgi:ankyrin repeat protein
MLAVWYPNIVKELITAKANINITDKNKNNNPISFAIAFGMTETVEQLVEAGSNINEKIGPMESPAFFSVVGTGKLELLKYLVSKGADTKAVNGFNQSLIMAFGAGGKTPTEKVTFYKMLEEATIKAGNPVPASIKENQDESKFTPVKDFLTYIIGLGFDMNEARVTLLPNNIPGADKVNEINTKNKVTNNALSMALTAGNSEMIAALLENGADLKGKKFMTSIQTSRFKESIRINEGDMFLMAVKTGNINLVKSVVENSKVDVNKKYDGKIITTDCGTFELEGFTVLMLASAGNNKDMCEYLVSIGGKGMTMMKINSIGNAAKGKTATGLDKSIICGDYIMKSASYAEDFTSSPEVKTYLKGLKK